MVETIFYRRTGLLIRVQKLLHKGARKIAKMHGDIKKPSANLEKNIRLIVVLIIKGELDCQKSKRDHTKSPHVSLLAVKWHLVEDLRGDGIMYGPPP